MAIFLLVLFLDASLALRVNEAAARAGAGLATEHAALLGSAGGAGGLGNGTADAEEDHAEEVGGEGSPSPAETVATETSILTVTTESIAALDEACTVMIISILESSL